MNNKPSPLLKLIEAAKRHYILDKIQKAPNCILEGSKKITDKRVDAFSHTFFEAVDYFLKAEKIADLTYMERQDPCYYCKNLDDNKKPIETYDLICKLGHNIDENRSKCGCHDYTPENDAEERQQYQINEKHKLWERFDEKDFKLYLVNELFNNLKKKIEKGEY